MPILTVLLLAFQGGDPLPFQLDQINVAGHPDHPGINFERHPASLAAVEAGGVAAVDFNNDGAIDLMFTDTEGWSNHLYVNDGTGHFTEEATERGVAEPTKRRGSLLFFDMENDGDLDLLTVGYPGTGVPSFDLFSLFKSNGAPAWDFTEVTASAGGFQFDFTPEPTLIGEAGGLTGGDVDGDGYTDFFVTWFFRSYGYFFDQPRLFVSRDNPEYDPAVATDSPRLFEDWTIESDLDEPLVGWWWTPTLVDLDRDGDLDLHVAVDHGFDVVRLNDGFGTFGPDISQAIGLDGNPPEEREEMGATFGDPDNDGDLDIYTTNAYQTDRFYRNDTEQTLTGAALGYTDVSGITQSAVTKFGWGTLFLDLDNDGDEDLLAAAGNGSPAFNWFWENRYPELEADGLTVDMQNRSTELPGWHAPQGGLDVARALVDADFDQDGDLDLVVGRYGISGVVEPGVDVNAGYFENSLESTNGWVQIKPVGPNGSLAVTGTWLHLRAGQPIQTRTVISGGDTFLGQRPLYQHFGLRNFPIRWVAVRWPDGTVDVNLTPPGNRQLKFTYSGKDLRGDMNGDGVVNSTDKTLLPRAIKRPVKYDSVYGDWPWQITGDMDGNGVLDDNDVQLLNALLGG